MAMPTLSPKQNPSPVVLTSTGSTAESNENEWANSAGNSANYAFGIYLANQYGATNTDFISGASDQVAYTYKKLGGDVLDIELTVGNVYTAYEEAVLEYSYIVNIHQAKNVLGDLMGNKTGSFDQDGEMKAGELSSSLGGDRVELKMPRFTFEYSRRAADGVSEAIGIGGSLPEYSASFDTVADKQDYDLQSIIYSASVDGSAEGRLFTGSVGNNKVTIKKVFYKTPHAMWRFYGYYGGLNAVGNMSTYGMYSDDSTFEVIPAWQNKAQAMAYEDAIYTRNSHYSYEIKNNNLRLFPSPTGLSPTKFWVQFSIKTDAWVEDSDKESGADGVNNMNTLPFANIPYTSINSIGKQWIRRFALATAKEMLAQVRGKFGNTIPIPGDNVNLNANELLSQAKDEQQALREELKTVLDELTYAKLSERDATIQGNVNNTMKVVPSGIYTG